MTTTWNTQPSSSSEVGPIGVLASGSTLARTLSDRFAELVNVKDYGAIGDGTTDDTSPINAAIAAAKLLTRKTLYFPAGQYRTTAAFTTMTGNNWHVFGAGKDVSIIKPEHNGDCFSITVSSSSSFFGEMSDLAIEGNITGTYSSSVAIHAIASTSSATGLQYWRFKRLRLRNVYRGIQLDGTQGATGGSFTALLAHQFNTFDDIEIPVSSDGNVVFEGLAFENGGGIHSRITAGRLRGSNAAIRIGTSGQDYSNGDWLIDGVHVVTADVGLDMYGPTTGTHYNQNITITGCQFDNCSTATVRIDNLQNFRIIPSNSTASVGITLTNCSNYIIEDRNTITAQNVTLQGTLNTTSGSITDTNGTRITQDAAFRRSVNTGSLIISGGNTVSAGANLELYGGTHATLPEQAFIDAARHRLRSQNGGTTYVDVQSSSVTIGDGAYNGIPMRLGSYYFWVDSSGRLRIKSSAPSSDTDGTVVGAQS